MVGAPGNDPGRQLQQIYSLPRVLNGLCAHNLFQNSWLHTEESNLDTVLDGLQLINSQPTYLTVSYGAKNSGELFILPISLKFIID